MDLSLLLTNSAMEVAAPQDGVSSAHNKFLIGKDIMSGCSQNAQL